MVIDLGNVASWVGVIVAIGTPCLAICKWILNVIDRIENVENEEEKSKKEIQDSKEERMILLRGQLACLKGLKEQGCNGPVTIAIQDIEKYLINKSHN